ncbi:MAG: N-acetylglucosamine-6-phosphate deacetylase [Rubrobacteraceae bacterium]
MTSPAIESSGLVGQAILQGGLSRRTAVIVRDGRISEVVEYPRSGDLPKKWREVPGVICPGFIDLQINGAFGVDVGPEPEALKTLSQELPKTGTTSFLPTLISSPAKRYARFMEALEEASQAPGARILGAHLKGPFLSHARKGAHDPENLRPVDLGLLKEMLGPGLVRLMTLAPELPGAGKVAEIIREGGAVASVGHTDATYEEVVRAFDGGFTKATHLYNAMSPFMHRAPGAVGAILDDARAWAGIIVDGVHVHEGALRIAYRQKGPDGLILVTDAMEAAGMPSGDYELSGREGRLQDRVVRLRDGTIAGSALTMDRAVRNAVAVLGIPLSDAVRMASENPARALGNPEKGRIASDADADLVILGRDRNV